MNKKRCFVGFFVFLLIFTVLVGDANCQAGKGSGYWDFLPENENCRAVVAIETGQGSFGTGVLTKYGVFTAKHVCMAVDGSGVLSRSIKLTFSDGTEAVPSKVFSSKEQDVALLLVDAPDSIPRVPVDFDGPDAFQKLSVMGLGAQKFVDHWQVRHFSASVLCFADSDVWISCPLLLGDSGGPVIRNGQLVGVLCRRVIFRESEFSDKDRAEPEVESVGGPVSVHGPAVIESSEHMKSLVAGAGFNVR